MVAQILRTLIAAGLLLGTVVALALVVFLQWPLPQALAAGLLTPLAAHVLVLWTGALAAVIVGRGRRLPEGARLTDAGGFIIACLREPWVAWRTFLIAQPFLGHLPLADAPRGTRVPVLLVHGHFCNRAIWRPFARWLADRGHPVAALNLEPVFAPIEQHTDRVHAQVRRLMARTQSDRVALVGHSMGGLVLRAYLRDYGTAHVARLVTIGAPHRGTWLACLGSQANVRQMRPDSPWIRQLRDDERERGLPPTTVILSLHDNIVTPQADQVLDGATVLAWRGYGHVDLLYRKDVWEAVAAAIDPVPGKAPGPATPSAARTARGPKRAGGAAAAAPRSRTG